MSELPPLSDDLAALLRAAEGAAPPPPPGLEASVLAKVLATTAAGAGAAASATTVLGVLAAKPIVAVVAALAVAGAAGGGLWFASLALNIAPPSSPAHVLPAAAPPAPIAAPIAAPITAPALVASPPAAAPNEVEPNRDELVFEERELYRPPPARAERRSEAHLIDEARERLTRGDGVTALSLLKEHKQAYPRGRMSEERRALEVVALALRGDARGASDKAQAFERKYPASLFLEMVRAAVPPQGGSR